jgi:hypothetical protein
LWNSDENKVELLGKIVSTGWIERGKCEEFRRMLRVKYDCGKVVGGE